jgi:hypothetical protein
MQTDQSRATVTLADGAGHTFDCDVFCTCDRRTIVRKREQLKQLPLRVLTPLEWWAHVKPWGGLWC